MKEAKAVKMNIDFLKDHYTEEFFRFLEESNLVLEDFYVMFRFDNYKSQHHIRIWVYNPPINLLQLLQKEGVYYKLDREELVIIL
jgi:hypothetical protein